VVDVLGKALIGSISGVENTVVFGNHQGDPWALKSEPVPRIGMYNVGPAWRRE